MCVLPTHIEMPVSAGYYGSGYGLGPVGGAFILTQCCPGVGIPPTLFVQVVSSTGTCSCLVGPKVPIHYVGQVAGQDTWQGNYDYCGAGNVLISLTCGPPFTLAFTADPVNPLACQFPGLVIPASCGPPFEAALANQFVSGCCVGTITVKVTAS